MSLDCKLRSQENSMESKIQDYLEISTGINVPVETVPVPKEQQSRMRRITQAFSRFMQSCDPSYIEIQTEQKLHRVKVRALREALRGLPPGECPQSLKRKDLRNWLGKFFEAPPVKVQSKQIAVHSKPALKPDQKEDQNRLEENLGIQNMGQPEKQETVVNLYKFLTKKGKKGINPQKLRELDYRELGKLSRALYNEFKEGTPRGDRLPREFEDDSDTSQSVIQRVLEYRRAIVKKWGECFVEKYSPDQMKAAMQKVLEGKSDPLEEEFIGWLTKQPLS